MIVPSYTLPLLLTPALGHRVTEEVMPLIQQHFGAASDPARVAFGGGSFGGVCALYAAMHYPHVFGRWVPKLCARATCLRSQACTQDPQCVQSWLSTSVVLLVDVACSARCAHA